MRPLAAPDRPVAPTGAPVRAPVAPSPNLAPSRDGRAADRTEVGPSPDAAHPAADPAGWTGAERAGLAAGVAITVAFAAVTIGTRSLWLDESYTVAAIHDPWLSLTRTQGTMALYYVLMWVWGQVGVAAWWVRVPSVVFAVATLWTVRGIARRIGGAALAAVAVPLVALQPMFQLKATEARSYSLMTLLVAVAWAIVLRSLDDDRRRWPLLFLLVALAGVLTQGLFVVHLVPMVALALTAREPRRLLATVAPGVAVAGAVALVLRSSGADTIGTFVLGGPRQWAMAALDAFVAGPPAARLVLLLALGLGGAASVSAARAARRPSDRTAWLVPLCWAVGPPLVLAVMSIAVPRFNPRYLTPITPGLGLLLAVAVRRVVDVPPALPSVGRALRVAVPTLVVVALLGGVVRAENPREDWGDAVAVVAQGLGPDDGLVFANLATREPEQHRPPFEVAWAEAGPDAEPTVLSSPRPLGRARRYEDDIRRVPEMAAAARAHPRVWFVGGSAGGSATIDEIVSDPAFDGLELVDTWWIPRDIEVRLYAWRA